MAGIHGGAVKKLGAVRGGGIDFRTGAPLFCVIG